MLLVHHREIEFSVESGESILNAARLAGISIPHTCGGQGKCRTCKFVLKSGAVRQLSNAAVDHEPGNRHFLSCQSTVDADVHVEFAGPVRTGYPVRGGLEAVKGSGAQITVKPRSNTRGDSDRELLVSISEAQNQTQQSMNARLARIADQDELEIKQGTLLPAPKFGSEEYSEDDYRAARRREKLLYFNIEFTNKCNLACSGCFAGFGDVVNVYDTKTPQPGYRHEKKVEGPLILEEILGLVDQAAALGAKTVDLIGGGEPLLSKLFFPIAEHAKSKGLSIEVFTNGTLITDSIAKRMAELAILPFVKLYSARSWVHDGMVGKEGAWQLAVNGIEALLRAGFGQSLQLPIALEAIVVRKNLADMPTLWRWARENGMIPYFERFVGCHYEGDPGQLLDSKELKHLWEELWMLDRGEYRYTWPLLPLRVGYTCATNFYSLYINYEGEIRPCSGVFIPLGNVRSNSLRDILSGSPIIKDLREYSRPSHSWCAGCYYYLHDRCPGCRGMAVAAGGHMEDDPLCFHNPRNLTKDMDPRNSPHLQRIG